MQPEEATSQVWWRERWERLVTVDVPDAELARTGRFFNILLLVNIVVVLCAAAIFPLMAFWGYLDASLTWTMAAFPLVFVPLSLFALVRSKQGHIKSTADLYIWLNFVGILVAAFLFDGPYSSVWALLFWPVALAAALIQPVYALRMSGLVVVVYLLTLGLVRSGVYVPVVTLSLEARYFSLMAFLVLMFFSVALLSYMTMTNMREVMSNLQHATADLEDGQRLLEMRVEERTSELADRAAQFQSIAELSRAFAGILNLNRLLETSVHLISERFDFYHTGVFMLDDAAEWAILKAASSEGGKKMLAHGHRLQVGAQGIVGYVASTSRSRIALDVGEDAAWFNNPDLPETRSEMGLPLIARGRLIGVLDIQSNDVSAFSEEDIQVLRMMADGLAIAIENTTLLAETRKVVERLERYQEEDAISGWRRALTRRNIQLDYAYDRVAVQPSALEESPLPMDPQGLQELCVIEREGGNLLLAPVRVRDRTVGVLSFESEHPWTEDAQQLAQQVVAQLGLALENARLLEDTRLSALQERARGEIVSRVRASVQVDAILRSAAEELGRALQVERARIQLVPFAEQEVESK